MVNGVSTRQVTITDITRPPARTYWIGYTDDTKTSVLPDHFGFVDPINQLSTSRPVDVFETRESWVNKLTEFNLEPNDLPDAPEPDP